MDDDFNTAGALASIFELTRTANSFMAAHQADVCEMDLESLERAEQTVVELLGVLGIDVPDEEEVVYPVEVVGLATELGLYHGSDPAEAVEALLGERAAARAAKDWGRADAVRNGLGCARHPRRGHASGCAHRHRAEGLGGRGVDDRGPERGPRGPTGRACRSSACCSPRG